MEKITLFDHSLFVLQFHKHEENKKKYMSIIEDIKASSMNTNNFHHTSVYQSPPGLQMNNAMDDLINSQEIQTYCKQKIHDVILPKDKNFACTSMWATIIPPGGQLVPKTYEGAFYGSYFLHSPADSGMISFYDEVPSLYFEKFGNVLHNEHNHNIRLLNMPEAGIFLVPSFQRVGTTTNTSEEPNIQLNFILDIIDK